MCFEVDFNISIPKSVESFGEKTYSIVVALWQYYDGFSHTCFSPLKIGISDFNRILTDFVYHESSYFPGFVGLEVCTVLRPFCLKTKVG